MTEWRLHPETYQLIAHPPHPDPYTRDEIDAIRRPQCPTCGTPIHVDAVDISTRTTGPGGAYLPGAMSCPNRCDPHAERRGRAGQDDRYQVSPAGYLFCRGCGSLVMEGYRNEHDRLHTQAHTEARLGQSWRLT